MGRGLPAYRVSGGPEVGVDSPPSAVRRASGPNTRRRSQQCRCLPPSGDVWKDATLHLVEGTHTDEYFAYATAIAGSIDGEAVDRMARELAALRERAGRLFVLGVGGGAGHASHAVNDFRKLCHIESYAPTDNVSELTARTNDDGWDTSLANWLRISKLGPGDALMVFSVGGGSRERGVSVNLVNAMELARSVGSRIYGIVGAPGGTLTEVAEVAVVIEAPAHLRTPLVESYQAVVWHALVSHPGLAAQAGHWETLLASSASRDSPTA